MTRELDDLHRTVRAGYLRAMKKYQRQDVAFGELIPLVRAYWPDMCNRDLRRQVAVMIAKEPAPLG